MVKSYIEAYFTNDRDTLRSMLEPSFFRRVDEHLDYRKTDHYDFFIENFRSNQHNCQFFVYNIENMLLIGDPKKLSLNRETNPSASQCIILENQDLGRNQ